MARPKSATPTFRLIRRGTRYSIQYWQDGKQVTVSTGETDERRAQAALDQFAAGHASPEPPPEPTVADMLDGYLADKKDRVRGYATLEANAKALKRHLGNLTAESLTKERSRFYRRQRQAEGYEVGRRGEGRKKPVKDGTIIRELGTLRAALEWAKSEKWLSGDLPYVEMPPSPPPRDRWLTHQEADRLLASAKAFHIKLFLTLALYTAARAGAILELTWNHVDLENGMIDFGFVPGGKSRAVVPITTPLRPVLEQARQAALTPYVIEYAGNPVASVKRGTRAAAKAAGMPEVTPHILRHTAATWMSQRGVRIERIAVFLGHTNPRTTWRIYAKHQPDYLRDAMEALAWRPTDSVIDSVTREKPDQIAAK